MYNNYKIKFILIVNVIIIILLCLSSCKKADDNITDTDDQTNVSNEITEYEQKINTYLNMIYNQNTRKINFSTYNNINQFYGYKFLYSGQSVKINEAIVDSTLTSTRPGRKKSSIEYIVIHDTANNSSTAGSKAHANYLFSNPGVSWHYTVDETTIYHHIPDDEVAYHAGDGLLQKGSTYYNSTYKKTCITGGNANGIGIETCVNSGSDYGTTLFNTAILVSKLMIKYNLTIDKVKMHNNFSGKTCPRAIIESNYWTDFINLIQICYYYKTNLSTVQISFKSNTSYMDDLGRISSFTYTGFSLDYNVVINNGDDIQSYYFIFNV